MTRISMRIAGVLFPITCAMVLAASEARAQDPPAVVPTLTVDLETVDAEAPPGVRLDLVAEVVGVPVVLEQVSATADLALATVRVRSTASAPLAQMTLAVTAVRLAGGTPIRRTFPVLVTLPAQGTITADVSVPAADLAAVWVPGETGALEVAVVGATALDGSAVTGDIGPPAFLPSNTIVACGDATWHATASGETAANPESGEVLECDRHGLWRVPQEGAR